MGMLKEQQVGATTADVCRKQGISGASVYKFNFASRNLKESQYSPSTASPSSSQFPYAECRFMFETVLPQSV